MSGPERLGRAEVVALVREWHGALERNADVAELAGKLVRSGLLLRLPGATARDAGQFARWYRELGESCFDQRRDVLSVEVDLVSPMHAEVTVTLRWESRRWQRPAARSRWTGCLLTEQWLVVRQDGEPRIRTLVTSDTRPLPGSPPPVTEPARTAPAAEPTAPRVVPATGPSSDHESTAPPATTSSAGASSAGTSLAGTSAAVEAERQSGSVPVAGNTARSQDAVPGESSTDRARGELVAS
ncbi:MAG: hypothetical protein HOV94_14885 [Saccharothrix sp.]|nr:hypothetical protein [Saccharothrix sp.]